MEIFLALMAQPIAIAVWARWMRGFPLLGTMLALMIVNVLVANLVGGFYPAGVTADSTPGADTIGETLSPVPDLDLHLTLLTLAATGIVAMLAVALSGRRRIA